MRRKRRRNDQAPKSVTLLSAQRSWFKANNGINGRGPPEAGRMPFMPAVRLNQRSGALPKPGSAFQLRFFSDSLPPFSVFACSAVQSFGPLNVCCPNASSLVARFKLLSAGAGSKHGDLCNEQIRDSNERSNLSLRVLFAQAPFTDARRCCQKIHLRTSGAISGFPSSESGELSL